MPLRYTAVSQPSLRISFFLQNKRQTIKAGFFSDDEFHLIEGISDALLPETSTPGALDAKVPYFIDLVVKNCMTNDDQQMIKKGLQQMNEQEKFLSLSSAEKLDAVKKMDEAAFKENRSYMVQNNKKIVPDWLFYFAGRNDKSIELCKSSG